MTDERESDINKNIIPSSKCAQFCVCQSRASVAERIFEIFHSIQLVYCSTLKTVGLFQRSCKFFSVKVQKHLSSVVIESKTFVKPSKRFVVEQGRNERIRMSER